MDKGALKQNGVHLHDHEYATVKFFLDNGIDVELIPPSHNKGLRRPDIILQGLQWEIKSPQGKGKNTTKHAMQDAGHQSSNVIVDLRRCKLPVDKAIKELEYFFKISKRIRRLKLIINDEKIIDYAK